MYKKLIIFVIILINLPISIYAEGNTKGDISDMVNVTITPPINKSFNSSYIPIILVVIVLILVSIIGIFLIKKNGIRRNTIKNKYRRIKIITGTSFAILILFAITIQSFFVTDLNKLFIFTDKTKASTITNKVNIIGVSLNNSSAIISFEPFPGAKDYRVYDIANPMSVKYAGQIHIDTGDGQYWQMQSDNVTQSYPLLALQSRQIDPTKNKHLDIPSTQIEWNNLQDHLSHTLVVEAVDELGPSPQDNLYDVTNNNNKEGPIIALNQNVNTRLGLNMGLTSDGKMSTNGQGPFSNNPTVLASSDPFSVTAPPSIKAIPSSTDSIQTFYDTFDDSEKNNLSLIDQGDGSNPSGNFSYMNYTLNCNLNSSTNKNTDCTNNNSWKINMEAINRDLSYPFISGGHFMNVLFNEHTGSSWSNLGMIPQKDADLSNGNVLHMTMEVDSDFDEVDRRWVGFEIAPSTDPITSRQEIDFGNGKQPNSTNQALFINIFRNKIESNLYSGTTTKNIIDSSYLPTLPGQIGTTALDKRNRYDLFMTTKHVAVFENDSLLTQYDIPNAGLPYSKLSTSFSHYYYHAAAEQPELSNTYPSQDYFLNVFPYSDERHWDNMGFEVLPSTTVNSQSDFSNFYTRAFPQKNLAEQCPNNFKCENIGPVHYTGRELLLSDGFYVKGGSIESTTDSKQDGLRYIYQNTTSANITTELKNVASTGWGGDAGEEGGLMVRSSNAWLDPSYRVTATEVGFPLRIKYRTTQGSALQNINTNVNVTYPMYLKITNSANLFTSYYSTDGNTWTQIQGSTINVPMGNNFNEGLVQNSGNNILGEATFDNVSINGINLIATNSTTNTTFPATQTLTSTPPTTFVSTTSTPKSTPGSIIEISPSGVSKDFNNPTNNYGFSTLIIDPQSPTTVYTGTNYQGLYKTTNGINTCTDQPSCGATWSKINTGTNGNLLDSGRLWSLAIDPVNPQIIYTTAGYGEGGVLKSVDGGVNWTEKFLGTDNSLTPNLKTTRDIYAIAIDPYNHNHLLASFHYFWNDTQDSGLIESMDGGDTWSAHMPPANSGWGAGNAVWFLNNSSSWLVGSQGAGIWKTTDSGVNWTQVLTTRISHGGINSLYKSSNSIYLALENTIVKSIDNGSSWSNLLGDKTNLQTPGLPYASYESLIGDGNYLYAKTAYPDGAADKPGPLYSFNLNGGTSWNQYSQQSIDMGPFQAAYDSVNHIIYSANGLAGVFKLSVNPTVIRGDFNNSGSVNIVDLSMLLTKLSSSNSSDLLLFDLNKDNQINVIDLSIFLTLLNQ